jgi:YidC/Oxa1 family membrane protein insertase
MRALEPKLQEIKEKHKDNKEEYARKTLELYRTEGVNPFSGLVSIFIQLPVLFALYWVFLEPFATIDVARVYSFTPLPGVVSSSFLGLIDLASKSIILALLAGVTQYFQAAFAPSGTEQPKGTGMQADFTRAMNLQLRYVFPILIVTIAYSTSAAIALYFVTTNATGALQEWYVKRRFAATPADAQSS